MHPRTSSSFYSYRGGHLSKQQVPNSHSSVSRLNKHNSPRLINDSQSPHHYVRNKSTAMQSHSKIMYIIRGLPGSGKSTLARTLVDKNGVILSTDDYFSTSKGYFFDGSLVSAAHNWNQERAVESLTEGKNPIVIDNTNTRSWEMKPYMEMAIDFKYQIKILEPDTWWKFNEYELAKRNIHQVPIESISNMLLRYEKNVTIDSVLGRKLFSEYQKQCLGSCTGNSTNFYRKETNTNFVTPQADVKRDYQSRPSGWWQSSKILARPTYSLQPTTYSHQSSNHSTVSGINAAMTRMSISNSRGTPHPKRGGSYYSNRKFQQRRFYSGGVKPGSS